MADILQQVVHCGSHGDPGGFVADAVVCRVGHYARLQPVSNARLSVSLGKSLRCLAGVLDQTSDPDWLTGHVPSLESMTEQVLGSLQLHDPATQFAGAAVAVLLENVKCDPDDNLQPRLACMPRRDLSSLPPSCSVQPQLCCSRQWQRVNSLDST